MIDPYAEIQIDCKMPQLPPKVQKISQLSLSSYKCRNSFDNYCYISSEEFEKFGFQTLFLYQLQYSNYGILPENIKNFNNFYKNWKSQGGEKEGSKSLPPDKFIRLKPRPDV